jgi:hypothetical protein
VYDPHRSWASEEADMGDSFFVGWSGDGVGEVLASGEAITGLHVGDSGDWAVTAVQADEGSPAIGIVIERDPSAAPAGDAAPRVRVSDALADLRRRLKLDNDPYDVSPVDGPRTYCPACGWFGGHTPGCPGM